LETVLNSSMTRLQALHTDGNDESMEKMLLQNM
jgi:hypothetical protein